MVFAERAFEETETRFQGQSRPFRDTVEVVFGGQVADGEIDVLDHALHDVFSRIARTIEFSIGRADRFRIPRHVAEPLDLFEIEIGAEETGQRVVVVTDVKVLAVDRVFEQRVDIAQVGPCPAAARCGDRAAAAHLLRQVVVNDVVPVLVVEPVGREDRVEFVAESLQLVFVREKGFGRHLGQRVFVEPLFAGDERHGAACGQYNQ